MTTRGIRGATTIETDSKAEVLGATRELLSAMLEANPGLKPEAIASVLFTTTEDITSAYPALAAREIGWDLVPLMCAREIPVPGSLARCIRVLVHWNTGKHQSEINHIYLHKAASLRPDLAPGKANKPKEEAI